MTIAKINEININYKVEGQGEPLVMIMGLGSDKRNWMFQVPTFKKHYQLVTFDNRGVGKSSKPAAPYTTRIMADDTVGLMDYLGIKKAHILGVSMGGMIAQEIAINYPERVMKLILCCTYACDDSGLSGETPEWTRAAELREKGQTGPVIPLMFNRSLYKFIFLLLKIMRGEDMSASALAGFKGQRAACRTHQTLDRLSLIKSPTLVIVGTGDRLLKPTSSEVLAEKIPGTKLVKLKGGSHTFFVEMKNNFNKEVLNFLLRP